MVFAYVTEAQDIDDISTLFSSNWDQRLNTEIPTPDFTVSDRPVLDPILTTPGRVNFRLGTITETQAGYPYQQVNQRAEIIVDIWTRRDLATNGGTGRQFMHDVKQEVRRITYANKHSLINWQVMRYMDFQEQYEDSVGSTVGRFHGIVRLRLDNDSVTVVNGAELVAEDLFNRANGAIGADWTAVAGTWEIVNLTQAALQSATANAHVRFTRSGVNFKANHRIQVNVVTSAAMEAGLIFRWQDSTNYWKAVLLDVGGTRQVDLVKVIGGSDTRRIRVTGVTNGTPIWTNGNTVELAVNLCRDIIELEFNGAVIGRLTDQEFLTETDHGLFSNSDQLTRFDNFALFESGGSSR